MDKRHREHLQVLKDAGITIDEIQNGRGTHKKILASLNGRKAVFISACGAVGRRSETNFDNQVRRFLRECGINTAERRSQSRPSA